MLENLLAEQIPLLELGIKIHDAKKSEDLKPLHDRLTIMFHQMKEHVEAKYGARQLGPEFRLPHGHHRKSHSRASVSLTPQPDRPAPLHSTPDEGSATATPGLATKSRQNLMAKLQGGVNRKKSRASEDRLSGTPRQVAIRPIPEQCEPSSGLSYSSLGRNSRVSVPSCETEPHLLPRAPSPVASLASHHSIHSNRDSVISSSSLGSDNNAPPVPPKQSALGSAYSPLPLRTHAQDSRARDLEDSDHPPTSFNSHHIQNTHLDALQNNHGSSTLHAAVAAAAPIPPNLNSHVGQMSSSHSNSHGGPSHQNSNSHGGPTGSSHPIPSTKKKPAPLPPVRTPPTPPKKAPLRLPAENT